MTNDLTKQNRQLLGLPRVLIGVALASWMSGVLAEVFSPRRLMTLAFIIWIIFHVGFLTLGLAQQN